MSVVIVVPEAFSNFAKNENCLPYSELVAYLRQDNLVIGAMKGSTFIAGQGLDELQLDHVECLSARRGLQEAFLHWRVWHVANLADRRSEEHTSELQSLMRISYAVFCLKKKKYRTE